MIDLSGIWKVSYAPTGSDDGDPEELATLELKDGRITGNDPFGGVYNGNFTNFDNNLEIELTVTKSYDEAITIFEDLDYPLDIKFSGKVASADFVSLIGRVNDTRDIAVNCRRVGDPVR